MTDRGKATRIEDYALIGDCETAALISRDGSIDWLCWPRFDSDACFAALLGGAEHGRWLLGAVDSDATIERRYRPDTLILETRITTATGRVLVVDFMPPRDGQSNIVRLVIGESGQVQMRTELVLRFGYGSVVPWVTRVDEHTWRAIAGPDRVVVRTPIDLHGENLRTKGDFTVCSGQQIPFTLSYAASHLPIAVERSPLEALASTEAQWRRWAARCPNHGLHPAAKRSLLTLRALIYAPTGGIVAAPTTSLPEQLGGERNWDYRYCWLRDATLTLLALLNAGFSDEAAAWRDWLLRAVAGDPDEMQIMYGLAGERRLTERLIPWLPGYENSQPVRVGNEAHGQLQLDVYGEVMDALYQARVAGVEGSEPAWAIEMELLRAVESKWTQPDFGIWEVRGPPLHFTYSKVMAWVAFDRAIKSVEHFALEGPVAHWRMLRSRIHADICAHGWNAKRNTFVQSYGSDSLDASLLLLPAVGFLPAEDPRIVGTIAAIERDLLSEGLVLRYNTAQTDDGLPGGEGAFLACSFWLADAYAMSGRMVEAQQLFDRLLALTNDVGLLAEEYDVQRRRLVGNFPQAFSHVALINTVSNLSRASKPITQRANC
jgi:GH15 family glucan-1,4-alpha-glucosidase